MRKMYVMIGSICLSVLVVSCSNDNSLEQGVKDKQDVQKQEGFELKDPSSNFHDTHLLQELQGKNEVQENDNTMPVLEHNIPGRGSQDKDRDKKHGKPRQTPGDVPSPGIEGGVKTN